MANVRAELHQQRLKLYNMGLCDGKIAAEQDVTPDAIAHWRKRYGLKSNEQRGFPQEKIRRIKQMHYAERMDAYNQWMTDREMSEYFDVTVQTIWKWRKKFNLESNVKRRRKRAEHI